MSDISRLHNHFLKPRWEWRPRLNPNHPLSIGLVGLWLFNETGGLKAYDLSGKHNDGTLISGPTWKPGKFGQSLSFNGTSSYVNVPHSSSLNLPNKVTFAAWVYPTSFTDYDTVVAKDYGTGFWFGLYITTGTIQLWIGGAANQSDGAVQLNKWSHIAATWDGTTINYYINGVYDSSDTNSNAATTNTLNMYIGADRKSSADPFYWFPGLIDGVRIYNRVLLASEIRWLYQDPFAGIDVPIFKDYWPEVAAGGLSIPVAMRHYREMRN